jgi:hypothetical protein
VGTALPGSSDISFRISTGQIFRLAWMGRRVGSVRGERRWKCRLSVKTGAGLNRLFSVLVNKTATNST